MKKALNLFALISCFVFLSILTQAQIITTIAGYGPTGFTPGTYGGDGGPATLANLYLPTSVVFDNSGNLIIADYFNHRIRKINSLGIISTIAGNGTHGHSGDGGPATAAELWYPMQVAVDVSGNIYISDAGNNKIRKVSISGIITTIAGIDTFGYAGDGGPATAATLNYPNGVAVDNAGNVYIDDDANFVVRKINTSGIISTIGGIYDSGSPLGDGGPATSGTLYDARQIAVDASGNLFIADEHNNRIRKISAAGIITTVAGNGTYGFTGDGGQATDAELAYPMAVTVDAAGNLYIGDAGNIRVRKVSPSGVITTIAGNGSGGYTGDGGPATAAELISPEGIALDASGNIYFADNGNNRIRKISPANTMVNSNPGFLTEINFYPNPVLDNLTIVVTYPISDLVITNITGKQMKKFTFLNAGKEQTINVSDLPAGLYLIRINGNDVRKFLKE